MSSTTPNVSSREAPTGSTASGYNSPDAQLRGGSDSTTSNYAQQRSSSNPQRSVSPSTSPKPENVPVVVQHLREVFTLVSETLISDAYRYGLVNGTIEEMYNSFFIRSQRIVDQLLKKHGMEVYVMVMQKNLMRLLSAEFEDRTMEQVYYMSECCLRYQDPGMLFTSLLSTDCLEQLIEYTDKMIEEDRARTRHAAPRSRHAGSGGAAAGSNNAMWHTGPRGGTGPMAAGSGGMASRQGMGAGRGGGSMVGSPLGTAGMMGPNSADMYAGSGPVMGSGAVAGNSVARGSTGEAEMGARFVASPRSPVVGGGNGSNAAPSSAYHSIPAPRGMTAGYLGRPDESQTSTIKQPLPRSAANLIQLQRSQPQPQPQQPVVGNAFTGPVDRMGTPLPVPQRQDIQAPAAFLRDSTSGVTRQAAMGTPYANVPPAAPEPRKSSSPSPAAAVDRALPQRPFPHHHHHFTQANNNSSSGISATAGAVRLPSSQPMDSSQSSGMSAPASPPLSVMRGVATPNPPQGRPMMANPTVHHHHHHVHMHRDPFAGGAAPRSTPQASPSIPSQQPNNQGTGLVAGMPSHHSMDGAQMPGPAAFGRVASPQPPQPAGTPSSSVPSVASAAQQPQAMVQANAPRVVASMLRPHHHHHMHRSIPSQTASPASPLQTAPLGVTGPADRAYASSRVSSPPSVAARDAPSTGSPGVTQVRSAAASQAPASSLIPRHHHHHHHMQAARPLSVSTPVDMTSGNASLIGGLAAGKMQNPPSSIDMGAEDEGRGSATSWRESPASAGAHNTPAKDPAAAAEEVRAHLIRGGVDQRTAATVASLGCSLTELRSLPWPKMEHMLHLSGTPASVYPLIRDVLSSKEETSQLQQFLQRNNISGHSVSGASPNESVTTPLDSASTQSLSQRESVGGRAPLHVPQPRTRQAGTNSTGGSPLTPAETHEAAASTSSTGGGRGKGWSIDGNGDTATPESSRGRRGRVGGGRGGGRGRGGGEDAPICKYYSKPEGCQFGSNCRNRHVDA